MQTAAPGRTTINTKTYSREKVTNKSSSRLDAPDALDAGHSLFRSSSSIDRRFPMLSMRAISLFRSPSYLWLGSIASSRLKLFCFTLEHPDGLRYSPPPRACPAQGLECWYYLSSNGCIGRVRHFDISARDVGDTNPVGPMRRAPSGRQNTHF